MVGKVINLDYPKRKIDTEEIFKFENVSYSTSKGFKALDDITFSIKEGEIFGLAGIEGNGQEQIMQIVAGLRKATSGEVSFKGEIIANKKGNVQDPYIRLGMMSHVPIDRMKHAIVPAMSLKFNSMITTYNTPEFSKK
jgi:simple sugar transport system ATP-binding protein